MALWKAWHRPPVADTPPLSRGGRSPAQWHSEHSGSSGTNPDLSEYEYVDPAQALHAFNQVVDELESRYPAVSRSKLPRQSACNRAWAEAVVGRAPFAYWHKRALADADKQLSEWETMLNGVLRKDPARSVSKAHDVAMTLPGGMEAWLEYKTRPAV
jgi:hypothetical protein